MVFLKHRTCPGILCFCYTELQLLKRQNNAQVYLVSLIMYKQMVIPDLITQHDWLANIGNTQKHFGLTSNRIEKKQTDGAKCRKSRWTQYSLQCQKSLIMLSDHALHISSSVVSQSSKAMYNFRRELILGRGAPGFWIIPSRQFEFLEYKAEQNFDINP